MAAASKLNKLLTRDALRRLAGARSFERGEEYFANGQVMSLLEHAGKLTAAVQGTEEYQVEILIRGNALDYDCTCPVGADGEFCKHGVAAGLAWLAHGPGKSPKEKMRATEAAVVTLDDARAWLAKHDKPKLIEMLLDQAITDTPLRERLLLQAAKTAVRATHKPKRNFVKLAARI